MAWVFSYGTLRDPEVQRSTLGRALPGAEDELVGYQLTTIEQPLGRMIEATVALLQRYLAGDALPRAENVVLPGTLVVRNSARRPHAAGAPRTARSANVRPPHLKTGASPAGVPARRRAPP